MRLSLYLLLSVFMLLLSSCSDNSVENPLNNDSGKGELLLRIDRQNAPQEVITVTATISRDGFSNRSITMNLLSDTTASASFLEVSSGVWHLKVEAFDAGNVVIFRGETDVNVTGGQTTNVSLQLQPTGAGVGNIYILVGWGTHNLQWIDYPQNPILSPQFNQYDHGGIAQPVVYRDTDKYRLYYAGIVNGGVTYVMYAESDDGINWNRPLNTPIMSPNPNSWDSWGVHPGPVIKENGVYKMYYNSGASADQPWHIGLAVSSDGKNWEKYQAPVIYGGSNYWDYQVFATSLVKKDGVYYLFFTGRQFPNYNVGLATSTDGINWTRSTTPVLSVSFPWEGSGVSSPSVIYEHGMFKMVYTNYQSEYTMMGFASSIDGINWTKNSEPFFGVINTHNHWTTRYTAYPYFNIFDGQKRIYYTGFNGSPKIGMIQYK